MASIEQAPRGIQRERNTLLIHINGADRCLKDLPVLGVGIPQTAALRQRARHEQPCKGGLFG